MVEPTKLSFPTQQPKKVETETAQPTKISFVSPAPKPVDAPTQLHIGNVSTAPVDKGLVDTFRSRYGELHDKNQSNIDAYLHQLYPLNASVLLSWGDNALNKLRTNTTEVGTIVQALKVADVQTNLDKALEAIQPAGNLWNKMFSKATPIEYESRLIAGSNTMVNLIPRTDELKTTITALSLDIMSRMAVLSIVAQYVGSIPDATLEMTLNTKRSAFQQASQQIAYNEQQVIMCADQAVANKLAVDSFINVTLPAWKSARSS